MQKILKLEKERARREREETRKQQLQDEQKRMNRDERKRMEDEVIIKYHLIIKHITMDELLDCTFHFCLPLDNRRRKNVDNKREKKLKDSGKNLKMRRVITKTYKCTSLSGAFNNLPVFTAYHLSKYVASSQ